MILFARTDESPFHLCDVELARTVAAEIGGDIDVVERAPAHGCFVLAPTDDLLAISDVLSIHLGSREHRAMMARFGFPDDEVDLVVT